nr:MULTISPECIES: inovirus-type Gp2 protein [unclassified Providencia]
MKGIFELNQRCRYLAKEHTKYYGDGERSFGCSR